jgi:hypothetical protein
LKTLGEKPSHGFSLWIAKAIAQKLGLPDDIVGIIFRAASIRIEPPRTWCVGKDLLFYEKAADVISQYMDSPEGSLAITLGEKSCIQSIEREVGWVRTRSGGHAGAVKNTCTCHGHLDLFVGLDIKSGIAHA